VSAVAEAVGIARPHLSAMRHRPAPGPRGRPPLPDAELVHDIPALVADLPTPAFAGAGSMATAAFMLCCAARNGVTTAGSPSTSATPAGVPTGWRSPGHNGEKVRVAFALDCCDREAMGHVATGERLLKWRVRYEPAARPQR
jgi:putative transposase